MNSGKHICPKVTNQKAILHETQTKCFKRLFFYAMLFFMVEHLHHFSYTFSFHLFSFIILLGIG